MPSKGPIIKKTTDEGMYYLYQHVRTDKNVPFYIGIGIKRPREDGVYFRAGNRSTRSVLWTRIAKKTEYVVEIIIESDDLEFIKKKEIELIKKYRRIKDGGSLANFTLGGEGAFGLRHSEKTKELIRRKLKGRRAYNKGIPMKEESKKKVSQGLKNYFKDPKNAEKIKEYRKKISGKKVVQYDKNGNFIKEWDYIIEASSFYNLDRGSITKVCKNQRKTCGGFIWKFKNHQYA